MLSHIEQEIQAYAEKILNGQIPCNMKTCPNCRLSPDCFNLHDVRERTFLVVVQRLVRTVLSLLVRWKCPLCGKTFTDYPSFALPYKRYVRQTVMDAVRRCLENDRMSYRQGVCKQDTIDWNVDPAKPSLPVYYEGKGRTIDERALAHSTLHHWITTLGSFKQTVRTTLSLLIARGSDVHRKARPIPARKYRSQARRTLLQDSLLLFNAEDEFRFLFGISIFPQLATAQGWT